MPRARLLGQGALLAAAYFAAAKLALLLAIPPGYASPIGLHRPRAPCGSRPARGGAGRAHPGARAGEPALPPDGGKRGRLRDSHARRRRARRELEPGRPAHLRVPRRRDHRPALLAFLSAGGRGAAQAALGTRGRHGRRPLRGGGLAPAQGRLDVLGERRHHRGARQRRSAPRLRQGGARPHRAQPLRGRAHTRESGGRARQVFADVCTNCFIAPEQPPYWRRKSGKKKGVGARSAPTFASGGKNYCPNFTRRGSPAPISR